MRNTGVTWLGDGAIQVTPPRKPKKITGTRFASILGLNRWSTPFEAFCNITRTWEEPFVDNIYTIAGKVIEPKIIEYIGLLRPDMKVITAEDVYGPDPFRATWGDFFKEEKIFGGMWDCLLEDEDGNREVVEIKTTKRAEDWLDGPPEYYRLQAALYAYLLGVTKYHLVVAFLEDVDYESPELWQPSADRVLLFDYSLEGDNNFLDLVKEAEVWYSTHISTGVSPIPDPQKDDKIIRALTTHTVELSEDVKQLVAKAAHLTKEIESVKPFQDELKLVEDKLKEILSSDMSNEDKYATVSNGGLTYTLTLASRTSVDKKKMQADGVYELYTTTTPTTTLRKKWES